jgi:Glyoxalase-like domain
MTTRLVHIVIDANDVPGIAQFWAAALGWDAETDDPEEADVLVERLLDLGARPADVGQGEVTWTVLADPDGNEFCVLTAR